MKPAYKAVSLLESTFFEVIRQESKEEFDYPWHYHSQYELTFIINTQGIRYVGNNIENFFDNDLVLLGSNLPHCWISTMQPSAASAIVIYFNADLVQWLTNGQFKTISQLFENANQGIKFSSDIALGIKSKLDSLLNVSPFERYILLLEILQALATTDQFELLSEHGFSYELNHANNERINSVYEYVRKNYHRKLTLLEIATHVNMSEDYFSRFFSKSLMKSFFTFLNEYRINRACKLLIETDKQISEICYCSGFESIPFFYRQFKKIKKCPPQSYRMQYKTAAK